MLVSYFSGNFETGYAFHINLNTSMLLYSRMFLRQADMMLCAYRCRTKATASSLLKISQRPSDARTIKDPCCCVKLNVKMSGSAVTRLRSFNGWSPAS